MAVVFCVALVKWFLFVNGEKKATVIIKSLHCLLMVLG